MAAGEETWAQGWSEPDAGSDLAGIKSRATRDGDDWVLNGQKTWSTRAVFCDYLFGLFRSDPEAERHRGLTYFLVPLDAAGVTVRPVGGLHDDVAFAEVFLEDVVVGAEQVLGEVDNGWKVAMATASSERGLTLRSPGRFMAAADRLVDLYRRTGADAAPRLRDEVTRAWMAVEAYRLYTLQSVSRMLATGKPMGVEASLNKIWWSELDVHLHETAQKLLGPHAELGLESDCGPRRRPMARRVALLAGRSHLRRDQRDPAQRRGRAGARPSPGEVGAGHGLHLHRRPDRLPRRRPRPAGRPLLRRPPCERPGRPRTPGTTHRWSALADMGVLGAVASESDGGLGLGLADVVLLAEESGRAALPEPMVDTRRGGSRPAGRGRWPRRRRGRSGSRPATPGSSPPCAGTNGSRVPPMPIWCWSARVTRSSASPSATWEVEPSVDRSRRLARRVAGEPDFRVGGLDPALDAAFDRGATATAAQLVGVARHLIETTVAYAQERQQFGQPIGGFQAVKHHLADALLAVEFAAPVVYRAAWMLDGGEATASRDASMAKAMAGDAAEQAARVALQVHGAIGFTFEYDLHLWMKRAWALAADWRDADWHRERVARVVLDGA